MLSFILLEFTDCTKVDLLKLFRQTTTKTPFLYSNGILLFLQDHSEILFLLSNSKAHIDVVIRGYSPMSHWYSIDQKILSKLDVVVDILSPDELFYNKKTFPLILDHLNPFDGKKLAECTDEEAKAIINGKPGEVQFPPPSAWSFLNGIQVVTPYPNHPPVNYLELKPPVNGGQWENNFHRQEFERVACAFEYFVGLDGLSTFKLDKVILIQNDELETRFLRMYNEIARQPTNVGWKLDQQALWRQAILNQVCTTIVLCCVNRFPAFYFCKKYLRG